jgi:hypothetical protein
MEETKIINRQENQRPPVLRLFLILSMVNGVMSVLSNLIVYSMIDFIRQTFDGKETVNMMGMVVDLSLFMSTDKNFFLFQTILFTISFFGALIMWNYRKTGFHLYTTSQILLLIVSTVYLTGMPFPIFDVMVTALFVYIYAKHLKLMQ